MRLATHDTATGITLNLPDYPNRK